MFRKVQRQVAERYSMLTDQYQHCYSCERVMKAPTAVRSSSLHPNERLTMVYVQNGADAFKQSPHSD